MDIVSFYFTKDKWAWPKNDYHGKRFFGRPDNYYLPLRISEKLNSTRTVIQAGGFNGLYPKLYSSVFNHVYTFEPSTNNYFALLANTEDCYNITARCCALGNINEKFYIVNNRTNKGANQIVSRQTSTLVQMRQLDNWQFDNVDLIHLDVEGFELFTLQGAVNCIRKNQPVIVIEQNHCMATYGITEHMIKSFFDSIDYYFIGAISKDYMYGPK